MSGSAGVSGTAGAAAMANGKRPAVSGGGEFWSAPSAAGILTGKRPVLSGSGEVSDAPGDAGMLTDERAAPCGGAEASGAPLFSWPAPAKLNLLLHIVGRRPDGYHELQTCFQFVDLCDEIRIEVRSDGEISRARGATGVAAEADLCIRAARALKAAAGCALGAHIDVVKRIPMGAGLGGGSSDAATCLVALNRLWDVNLPTAMLAQVGLKLGADVPVFVRGRAAWAEGVGERLTPLFPPLAPPERNYLIVKPNVSVSTAEVFQDPELTRDTPPITIHGFLASGGRNDCVGVVRRRYPEVARALDWLSTFGTARLTGTGACIFLGLESMERGREIVTELPSGFEAFLVRGLNDSPLLERSSAG